jgi:hypothetical protein
MKRASQIPMPTNEETVRDQIARLLKECKSEKVRCSGDAALDLARQAVALSHSLPLGQATWKAEASYRYAHLLFRKSQLAKEELEEIFAYFDAAAQDDCLGPLPRIYQLPVLRRLEAIASEHEKHHYKQLLIEAWERSIEAFRKEKAHEQKVIQNQSFNLLELAAYFLDLSLDQALGLGALEEFRSPDCWKVIGENMPEYDYSESFARSVFEAEMQSLEDTLLIVLSPNENRWAWKTNSEQVRWKTLKGAKLRQARLLVIAYSKPWITSDELLDQLHPEEIPNRQQGGSEGSRDAYADAIRRRTNSLNKDRGRVEDSIARLAKSVSPMEVFVAPGKFQLTESLKILALVEEWSG